MHTILSGPVNSGKSTRLLKDVWRMIAEGKKVSGWVSVSSSVVCRPLSVEKKEYDILFITMSKIDEPRRFVRLKPFENSFAWNRFHPPKGYHGLGRGRIPPHAKRNAGTTGLPVGLHFDRSVFDDVVKMDFGCPDVFVIDEVGPLELYDRSGFWAILPRIYSSHKETITVVRKTCVEKFKESFPALEYLVQSNLEY